MRVSGTCSMCRLLGGLKLLYQNHVYGGVLASQIASPALYIHACVRVRRCSWYACMVRIWRGLVCKSACVCCRFTIASTYNVATATCVVYVAFPTWLCVRQEDLQ